jgi:pyruvate formate lyase activating enzyme
MKGCPLSCWWCHNPESRQFGKQILNGRQMGEDYTAEQLLNEIEKDRIFYDESGGGVTFSGGEPLAQPVFLSEMLDICREADIHTAVDTTGYAGLDLIEAVGTKADLILYDIKLMDPVEHLKYTGISNTEILENLDYLLSNGSNVIIRIPLIPGITVTKENLDKILEFLSGYNKQPEVNLLPYHRIAEGKYHKYGIKYMMKDVKELTDDEIAKYKTLFENAGFKVKIGG